MATNDQRAAPHVLTIVKHSCNCDDCGKRLSKGGDAVYRHEPREIICQRCARARGLDYGLSRSWREARNNRKPRL
jgi:hypothetical protein